MLYKAATLILSLVVTLAIAQAGLAQGTQTAQDAKTQKVKEQVRKIVAGDKVTKKVKLNNGTTYQGYLSNPTDDSFVMQDKTGGSTTVKYSEVASINRKDTPIAALIVVGAGAAAAAVFLLAIFHRDQ